MTSKNQFTLPKHVVQDVGAAEYFDVKTDHGTIVLTPVRIQRARDLLALRHQMKCMVLTPAQALEHLESDDKSRHAP